MNPILILLLGIFYLIPTEKFAQAAPVPDEPHSTCRDVIQGLSVAKLRRGLKYSHFSGNRTPLLRLLDENGRGTEFVVVRLAELLDKGLVARDEFVLPARFRGPGSNAAQITQYLEEGMDLFILYGQVEPGSLEGLSIVFLLDLYLSKVERLLSTQDLSSEESAAFFVRFKGVAQSLHGKARRLEKAFRYSMNLQTALREIYPDLRIRLPSEVQGRQSLDIWSLRLNLMENFIARI